MRNERSIVGFGNFWPLLRIQRPGTQVDGFRKTRVGIIVTSQRTALPQTHTKPLNKEEVRFVGPRRGRKSH